jgi:hypothetical protein
VCTTPSVQPTVISLLLAANLTASTGPMGVRFALASVGMLPKYEGGAPVHAQVTHQYFHLGCFHTCCVVYMSHNLDHVQTCIVKYIQGWVLGRVLLQPL